MKRKIISIEHPKCTGCGMCVPDCPEGALQIIDGKARLVGDILCDGLGACLKSCPENAISVEERQAEPYDEFKVLENIIPQGRNVIRAHLKHLADHGQAEYLSQALSCLRDRGIPADFPMQESEARPPSGRCPGSQTRVFAPPENVGNSSTIPTPQLTHWPIQLHLISPSAPHYRHSDLLVAADCAAFSHPDFHRSFLKGRTLVIACPKLDARQEVYMEKLTALIDQAELRSIRVVIMEVPCCGGLLRHVITAANRATHTVPVSCVVVGIRGEVLNEMPIDIRSAEAFAS